MEKVCSCIGTSHNTMRAPHTADCPVCLLTFEDRGPRYPKLLSCQHAFCSSCLGSLLNSKACKTQLWNGTAVLGLCCPLCRRFTHVPGGIISLLPDYHSWTALGAKKQGGSGKTEVEMRQHDEESSSAVVCELSVCVKQRGEQQRVNEEAERSRGKQDPSTDTPRSVLAARRMLALLSLLLLILLALLPLHHSPTVLTLVAITALLISVNIAALCHHHQQPEPSHLHADISSFRNELG